MEMKNGHGLIKQIEDARKEVNKQNRLVENAEFHIAHLGDSTDNMWFRIKAENEKKLEDAKSLLESLMSQFYLSKEGYASAEWQTLLNSLGEVIAETNNISHVKFSNHDEHDLHRALDETSSAIIQAKQRLREAEQSGDNDAAVLATAELNYYEDDMRQHHWGEARLKELNSENIDSVVPGK